MSNMNKEILEENIYYYKNVIDDPESLVKAIEETENQGGREFITKWKPWVSFDGQPYRFGIQKTVYPIGIKKFNYDNKKNEDYILSTITNAFYKSSKDYSISLLEKKDPSLFLKFDIKKYRSGAHMGTHADQYDTSEGFKHSLVMYINDDYDGGEISFIVREGGGRLDPSIDSNKINFDYQISKKEIKDIIGIKPEAGSVVVFPSYPPYYHTAHTIKGGEKYMITTFIH